MITARGFSRSPFWIYLWFNPPEKYLIVFSQSRWNRSWSKAKKRKGRRKDVVDNQPIKMGCELSKLTATKSRNQNAREGSPPPPQTTTDPRLPLTARQKFTVMASWRAVGRALEPTGVYMFIRFVLSLFFPLSPSLSLSLYFSTSIYISIYLSFCFF